MTTSAATVLEDGIAQALSERLADVFRAGRANEALAEDLFFDGHPPFWRFQLAGRESFDDWLRTYSPDGSEVTVVRTLPTATGFVTEFTGRHHDHGEEMTDRQILLCEVRDRQVAQLTMYCSGDWDRQLRERHAAEAPIIRP